MKCLLRYQWVKLPRTLLPAGKGLMGYWTRLAAKAAFRKGQAKYCGHINEVNVGMWSGGMVGLKSILGVKNRQKALEIMDNLSSLGYILEPVFNTFYRRWLTGNLTHIERSSVSKLPKRMVITAWKTY